VTLTSMSQLVTAARKHGRGIGAFNVIQLEHAEAIIAGAQRADLPVVLQISENTVRYHGALAPLAQAMLRMAADASVGVVVHLDHAASAELVRAAVTSGCRR
jgi:fructose-bisphosphate aldolase class II